MILLRLRLWLCLSVAMEYTLLFAKHTWIDMHIYLCCSVVGRRNTVLEFKLCCSFLCFHFTIHIFCLICKLNWTERLNWYVIIIHASMTIHYFPYKMYYTLQHVWGWDWDWDWVGLGWARGDKRGCETHICMYLQEIVLCSRISTLGHGKKAYEHIIQHLYWIYNIFSKIFSKTALSVLI